MSDQKILSKEEVDALLSVSKEAKADAAAFVAQNGESREWVEDDSIVNQKELTNITELTQAECEKNIATFLRKKVGLKARTVKHGTLTECLEGKTEKHIYSVFHIDSHDSYGMIVIDYPLLHHAINLLYGGQFDDKDPLIETPGKIGIIVAEKLCQLGLDGFAKSCEDFGQITRSIIKTMTHPNLTSKLNMEDHVCAMDMSVYLGDVETTLMVIVIDSFFRKFIPIKAKEVKHVESNFWRSAIESQVIDSIVTVNATLSDVSMKVNEVLELKSGDLIPIGDPTLVYVCLNNLKLFRANAGQANSKRVAKILSEV